jgi:hypothetical protein
MNPKSLTQTSIKPFLIDALKHFKILYPQSRTPKVHVNTYNIEDYFCFNLGNDNPNIFWATDPRYQNLPHVLSTMLADFSPPLL